MQNKPIKCLLTNNICYKQNIKQNPKGIILHSLNDTYIERYILNEDTIPSLRQYLPEYYFLGREYSKNNLASEKCLIGGHAIIGYTSGDVLCFQLLPWRNTANTSGFGANGSCDNNYIQIFLCKDKEQQERYFKEMYNVLVNTLVYLCKKFNTEC